jgi:hypothetical protein
MLVTTPPQLIRRTVVKTVSHEKRRRHAQRTSDAEECRAFMLPGRNAGEL